MPTTMYAKVRRVLLVLWLVRNNDESNTVTTTGITRRTGLDARTVRRILAMLHRRGLVQRVTPTGLPSAWLTTPKGNTFAERIQRVFTDLDNARRAGATR
jgi:predicted transcriptional regulator